MDKYFWEGSEKDQLRQVWVLNRWSVSGGNNALVWGGIESHQDFAAFNVIRYNLGEKQHNAIWTLRKAASIFKRKLFTTLRINWCSGINMSIGKQAIFISALSTQQKRHSFAIRMNWFETLVQMSLSFENESWITQVLNLLWGGGTWQFDRWSHLYFLK